MVTCICQYCNTEFELPVAKAKNRKFCSQKCMGESYKKPLIETPCETCGKLTFRTQYRLDYTCHHYCSKACADKGFKGRFIGSANANWKGGSIDGRGSNWATIREEVVARGHNQCAECGMPSEAHHEKYGKELHVHHITPYRLTQDNHPSNLTPLCIPCHRRVETKLNATITPMEKLLMAKNTEAAQSKGLDKKRDRTVPCPACDGRKTPRSKTCQKCWAKNHPRRKPKPAPKSCPDCGVQIVQKSKTCHSCYMKRKGVPEPGLCPDCGMQMLYPRSKRCRPCQARINGRLSKGGKRS